MMYDPRELPPKLASLVERARLPKNYQAAKAALAACDSLDQCADWADKALAIASYARQADDPELENWARRIRLRATRRCGELLKDFDARGGNRRSKTVTPLSFVPKSRAIVAQEAGLTEHKARTAVSLANIPAADFEEAVESERPPGTTLMAQLAKLNRPEPVNSLTGDALADILRRGCAKDVVQALLQLEKNARYGTDAVLEFLLDPSNAEKLERVWRGIGFAIRLKDALDRAGVRGNPLLRVIEGSANE